MAARETLELDISDALDSIGQINLALVEAASGFSASIVEALTPQTVTVTPDPDALQEGIVDAVKDTEATAPISPDPDTIQEGVVDAAAAVTDAEAPIDADTSSIPGEIEDAAQDAEPVATVDADTDSISDEIEAAASDAEPVTTVEADTDAIPSEIEDAVASADTTAPIDPDTDQVAPAIEDAIAEADATVVVDADTSAVASEIEDAVSSVDATVTPSVDTSGATAGLSQLTDSADSAAGSVAGVTQTLTGVAGSSVGAATSVGALSGAFLGMTRGIPVIGQVAIGLSALVAFSEKAFESAVNVQAAVLRENQTFGVFKSTIENIKVGNLSIALGDLNKKLGSGSAQVRQAAASFGQMGIAAGAPVPAIASTTSQLIALSARAVALNPALGTVGDVLESLSTRLARGGRFAAQYGIALTSTEIKARAVANAHGKASNQLTQYELTVAAAQLATERYGKTLQQSIEEGTKNPIIQLRQLGITIKAAISSAGAPLVAPIFTILRGASPVLVDVIGLLGLLARVALPPVALAMKVVGFAAQTLGDAVRGTGTFLATVLGQLKSGDWADAGTTIRTTFAGIGTTIRQTVEDTATGAQSLTTRVVNAITTGAPQMGATIGTFFQRLGGRVGLEATKFADLISGGIHLGLSDAAKALAADILKFPAVVTRTAKQIAAPIFDAGKTVVAGFIDGIHNALPAFQVIGEIIGARVKEIALGIPQQIRDAAPNVLSAFKLLFFGAIQVAASARETIGNLFHTIGVVIGSAIAGVGPGIASAVRSWTNIIVDEITNGFPTIRAAFSGIGGVIGESLGGLGGIIKGAILPAVGALIPGVPTVIFALAGPLFDAAKSVFFGIVSAATDIVPAVIEAVNRIGTAIADSVRAAVPLVVPAARALAESVVSTIEDTLGNIATTIQINLPGIAAAAAQVAATIPAALVGAATAIPAAAGPILTALHDWITGTAVPDIQLANSALVGPMTQWLKDSTATAALDLENFALSISTWAIDEATSLPAQVLPLTTGFISWISNAILQAPLLFASFALTVIGNILEFGARLPGIAAQLIPGIINWIIDAAGLILPGLANFAGVLIGFIARQAIELPGRVDAIKAAFLNWILNAAAEAPGRLEAFAGALVDFIRTLPGRILTEADKLKDILLDTGKNIIEGLIRGATNAIGGIGSLVSKVKDAFLSGFSKGFDSHSPARVMYPLGRNITDGILVGMQQNSDQIVATAGQIAQDAANALAPNVAFTAPNATTAAGAAAGRAVSIGDINVTATVNGVADPVQAREAGTALGEAAAAQIRAAIIAA